MVNIGPESRNTCLMVHLSEVRLKTGMRAVTVRYRGKRMVGRNRVSVFRRESALFFGK